MLGQLGGLFSNPRKSEEAIDNSAIMFKEDDYSPGREFKEVKINVKHKLRSDKLLLI